MAWRQLTENDLLSALNVEEKSAYESLVLDAGQPDLVNEILDQVTDELRSRIAACKGNTLGPSGTVPSGAIYRIMPLVIYRMMTRLDIGVDDSREEEWKEANRWLRDVANCKVMIERPVVEGPVKEQGYGNATVVRKGSRKARREDMEGLL